MLSPFLLLQLLLLLLQLLRLLLLWLLLRLLPMLLLATAAAVAAAAAALRRKDVHNQCILSPVGEGDRTMTRPSGDQPDLGSAKRGQTSNARRNKLWYSLKPTQRQGVRPFTLQRLPPKNTGARGCRRKRVVCI